MSYTGGVQMSPSHQFGAWDILNTVKVNDLYTVVKYKSPETGLELVHTHVDGPMIHAYCIIAHKCEDNCGIPDVIKHMIWHGSRRYPSSGLLNKIACKCFCKRPEIRTGKDHSCYSFSSAGKQGFSMFLPVFFDHVFNPIFHEAAFITEVYHVEPNGMDGGTCFNSMKAIENEPHELSSLSLFRMAFGESSGYSFNHKGASPVFRSECNLEKVRHFHEKFYHGSNCCLVVVGDIAKEDLFRALAPVLQNLLKHHRVKPVWTKPWLEEPLGQFPETAVEQIEYPCSFIERPFPLASAYVKIGIIAPPSTASPENFNRGVAMRLILEYLKGPISNAITSQSLPNENNPEGIFSLVPSVEYAVHELKQTIFTINFHNVPIDVVPNIPKIVRRTMTRELKRKIFKTRRMVKLIEDFYQRELNDMENCVAEKIARAVIPDFLYSSQESSLLFDQRINSAYTIHLFLTQNIEFWKHVLQACFLDVKWATVVAMPSQTLHEKLETEMLERIEWRLESDNIKYTKRWTNRLAAAKKLLSKSPPWELVKKYPLPNAESIGLIRILRQDNPAWANDTLCNLYVDDINSNYACLTVIMDTSELKMEQRKHLVLFADALTQAPYIDKFDKFHTAKECQSEIRSDVLNYETYFGLEWSRHPEDKSKFASGNFSHLLCLRIHMEISKVKEGFTWAQILLWNTKWQAEKLKEVALKLSREADELQNKGTNITNALLTDSLYQMNSVPRCISLIRQKVFLRQIAEDLPKSIRRLSKMLESIRNALLRPENVTVHLAVNLARMEFHLTENPDARFAISELFRTTFNYTDWNWEYETKRLANNADLMWMKSSECIKRCCSQQIFPVSNSNVGNLIQVIPGVLSYKDLDYPLLLLASAYFLHAPDGPLYKEIIQSGLAEFSDILVDPLEGKIYFELRACPDLRTAYSRTFDVIARHIIETRDGEGDVPHALNSSSSHWENHLLQSAKSWLILKLVKEESTPMQMAFCSLVAYYKGVAHDSSREIMDAITKATIKQVQNVARKYFYPLFLQPSTCAACVQSDRIYSTIEELMQRCGKRLSLVPPLEQSFLATFSH